MKNFKFLSALALTGMLTTGIIGTSLAANDTKLIGEFKPNTLGHAGNETVVAYLPTNYADVLTVSEMQANYSNIYVNGTLATGDTEVHTGDHFKQGASGTEKGVVVYGDVHGKGKVNINDVTLAAKIFAEDAKTLSEVSNLQIEAADVVNDEKISMSDVTRLARFYAEEQGLQVIDKEPEVQKPVTEDKYTISISEKYINNVNIKDNGQQPNTAVKATIKPVTGGGISKEDSELTNVKLAIIDEEKNIIKTLADHVALTQNMTEISEELDLTQTSTLPDGNITIALVSGDDAEYTTFTILGTTTIEKHTKEPTAVDVKFVRNDTHDATVSLTGFGSDGKVVEMYYEFNTVAQKGSISAPTVSSKSIKLNDNKLSNVSFPENLAYDTAYVVKFIVKDEFGSVSASPVESVIAKSKSTSPEPDVVKEKIVSPILASSSDISFTWEKPDEASSSNFGGYEVTLYKDGKMVKQEPASSATYALPISAGKIEPGEYYITVRVKGSTDGEKIDSLNAVQSETVKVEQLKAVSNITIGPDTENSGKAKISWESDYIATTDESNIKGYMVELGTYTGADEDKATDGYHYTVLNTSNTTPITNKYLDNITITSNKLYKARVTVIAKGTQVAQVDSAPEVSKEDFLNIDADLITVDASKTTTNSITLKINTEALDFKNQDIVYDVEVYKEYTEQGYEGTVPKLQTPIRENVNIEKATDGSEYIVIKDLTNPGNYQFKLVVHVGNHKGTSKLIGGGEANNEYVTLKMAAPEITGLKVSTEAGIGNIVINKTSGKESLNINNVEYVKGSNNFDDYYPSTLLSEAYSILDTAGLENDDVITLTEDKLTVSLPNREGARTFSVPNKKLELIGNADSKAITVASGKATEVILTRNSSVSADKYAVFNVAGINSSINVTLNDKVEITNMTSGNATIAKNANVLINDVKVNASEGLKLNLTTAKTFNIEPSAKGIKNVINFNNETTDAIIIHFNADATAGEDQLGSLTINSNADVTVTAETTSYIEADITITTTNGNVTVSDGQLAGTKDITVSQSTGAHTIVGRSSFDAEKLDALLSAVTDLTESGEGIEIKNYSEIKDKIIADGDNEITGLTAENVDDFIAFIDSFGTELQTLETKAKVQVNSSTKVVTITLPSGVAVSATSIKGLK